MKTAIIAIARNENPYIREWAEHHLGIGFDKIFVCDNGFGNEDSPSKILSGLENNIEILNWRNQKYVQPRCYTECYAKYKNAYDWIAFFDIDEFLILGKDKKISGFLSRFPKDAQLVSVNWEIMTDNGLVRYEDKPCLERFTHPMAMEKCVSYNFPENKHTKSIVRGGLQTLVFSNPHTPATKLISYHANLKKEPQGYYHGIDYSFARLRHFTTKTIDEWCRIKVPRGRVDSSGAKVDLMKFFKYNEKTPEKMAILKQFFPDGKTFRLPKAKPSLTVLGICSTDKKEAMQRLVQAESEKIRFLNPEISIAEINFKNKNFWAEFNRFCV